MALTSRLVLLGWVAFVACPLLASDPLDTWHWRNPLPTGNPVRDATYAEGLFVAVGDHGTILTSADAGAWTTRATGLTNTLLGIVRGAGQFVAVGEAGAILASGDGISWQARASGTTQNLNQLVFAAGRFVVVGDAGTVLVSVDSMDWELGQTGMETDLQDITHGQGLFIATSDGVNNTVLLSQDGVAWTAQSLGLGVGQFARVAHGNGRLALVGTRYLSPLVPIPGSVLVSTNGTNWSVSAGPLNDGLAGSGSPASVLRFLDGRFVAASTSGTAVFVSADAMDWVTHLTYFTNTITHNVAFGDGRHVLAGAEVPFLTSTNLVDWEPNRTSPRGDLVSLATGNGRRVAVGGLVPRGIPNLIYTSGSNLLTAPLGQPFTNALPAPGLALSAVRFAADSFVAVGDGGIVLQSPDGVQWSRRNSATLNRLFDAAHGDNQWVAIGENGAVSTSPNGAVWTYRFSGTQHPLYGICHGPAGFVAVGYLGTVISSPDGITWTSRESGTLQTLYTVASDGSGYLAAGEYGALIASADGWSWASRTAPTASHLFGLAFGAQSYVMVGAPDPAPFTQGNVLFTSANGIDWQARWPGTTAHLFGASFSGDTFLLVGMQGIVLESGFLTPVQLTGRYLVESGFEITVMGQLTEPCRLQATTDPAALDWEELAWLAPAAGPVRFVDTNAVIMGKRFYRTVSP